MKIYNEKPLSQVQKENKENEQTEANVKKIPNIEIDVQEVAEITATVLTDSSMVAELAAIILEDSTATAEALSMALEKIVQLESRVLQLEGGK